MTTTTIPTPTGEELAAACVFLADEDLVHAERACRPNVALCGASLTEAEFIEEGDDSPDCPECVAIERATAVAHGEACAKCRAGEL